MQSVVGTCLLFMETSEREPPGLPSYPGCPDLGWGGGHCCARGQGMAAARLGLGATRHVLGQFDSTWKDGQVGRQPGPTAGAWPWDCCLCCWLAVCQQAGGDLVLDLGFPTSKMGSAVMPMPGVLGMHTLMLSPGFSKDPDAA